MEICSSSNDQVINIDGFTGLQAIEGSLKLYSNDNLENIGGLSNVIAIGEDIIISENDKVIDSSRALWICFW